MTTDLLASAVAAPQVSVVVIGRNEGDRLHRCLQSVIDADWQQVHHEIIYVDSQSTDSSLTLARHLGAQALLLDDAAPCAAKARNLGWQQARGEYVLFLDGDTILNPTFVQQALEVLASQASVCAVWGHRRELHPEQSLYNRVLDLDWVYPVGRTLYFGGDVLIRRVALSQVSGFDPSLKAGEEPEMCARLRACQWEIEHIDAPMTTHDLAITTWRGYWLRAWRSGMAYAEVAERMRLRGDGLWQHEASRDFYHGLVYASAPVWFLVAWLMSPWMLLALVLAAAALVVRTARRCAWKAPEQWVLRFQYAIHSHLQKIPALFGQLAWHRARQRHTSIDLVDYKASSPQPRSFKRGIVALLTPLARLWQIVLVDRWLRVWSLARLQANTGTPIDASNVVMGTVEVQGTGRICLGHNALIYPGCYLETQGLGSIEIGDGVVLSRGVHIVAFGKVTLGNGCMVGEYSSLRDANHRLGTDDTRHSGHEVSPITLGCNVWLGRGVSVLKGVHIGDHAVVAANAVVTHPVPAHAVVAGIPAHPLHSHAAKVTSFAQAA